MGWPPECVWESSTIPCEKLTETTLRTMTALQSILTTHQSTQNGHTALMTMMKRSIPRSGQLPPKMEPVRPKGVTPAARANSLPTCIKQQENFSPCFCSFEAASTIAQWAMEHHNCCRGGPGVVANGATDEGKRVIKGRRGKTRCLLLINAATRQLRTFPLKNKNPPRSLIDAFL